MGIPVLNGFDLVGTLAERPSEANDGHIFWATDTKQLFAYDATSDTWFELGGAPGTSIADVGITIGAEAANVINVGLQLKDAGGADVASIGVVEAYLSDDSGGDGLTGTVPDGDVAIGTDGTILYEPVTDKVFKLQSEADGDIDLDIGHSAGKTWHLVVLLPNGEKVVSDAITFAA